MKKKLSQPEGRTRRVVFYCRASEFKRLTTAAAAVDLTVSTFCARVALDKAEEEKASGDMLRSAAFRAAIADVMSRPAVVADLAASMRFSTPQQLDLFRRRMKSGLDQLAKVGP